MSGAIVRVSGRDRILMTWQEWRHRAEVSTGLFVDDVYQLTGHLLKPVVHLGRPAFAAGDLAKAVGRTTQSVERAMRRDPWFDQGRHYAVLVNSCGGEYTVKHLVEMGLCSARCRRVYLVYFGAITPFLVRRRPRCALLRALSRRAIDRTEDTARADNAVLTTMDVYVVATADVYKAQ